MASSLRPGFFVALTVLAALGLSCAHSNTESQGRAPAPARTGSLEPTRTSSWQETGTIQIPRGWHGSVVVSFNRKNGARDGAYEIDIADESVTANKVYFVTNSAKISEWSIEIPANPQVQARFLTFSIQKVPDQKYKRYTDCKPKIDLIGTEGKTDAEYSLRHFVECENPDSPGKPTRFLIADAKVLLKAQ